MDRWREKWRSREIPYFIPPTLLFDFEDAELGVSKIGFTPFAKRARQFDSPSKSLILGCAGSGKTSMLLQLGSVTAGEEVMVAWLDSRELASLPDTSDPTELLRASNHGGVDDALWYARIKKRRLVILIDAVDEIHDRAGDTNQWRAVLRLLKGANEFSVVATSRSIPDEFLDDPLLDDLHIARLSTLSRDDAADYLEARGLHAEVAQEQIRAANLDGLAANPLFLTLIAGHLLGAGDTKLPRSRAALLRAECARAEKRSQIDVPSGAREKCLTVDAAFTGAMLQIFGKDGGPTTTGELSLLLFQVWPTAAPDEIRSVIDALMVHHLVVTETNGGICSIQPLHQCLVEFSLASVWRDTEPPRWALLRSDLDHLLGDWVGLQAEPSTAALRALDLCFGLEQPWRMIDVLVANRALINHQARVRIWNELGTCLTPASKPLLRLHLGKALGNTSRITLDEAVDSGLLRPLERVSQSIAKRVGNALSDGVFNHLQLHKELRDLHPKKSADNDPGHLRNRNADAELALATELAGDSIISLVEQVSVSDKVDEEEILKLNVANARLALIDVWATPAIRRAAAVHFANKADETSISNLLEDLHGVNRRSAARAAIKDLLDVADPNLTRIFGRILVNRDIPSSIRSWIIDSIDSLNGALLGEALRDASTDESLDHAVQIRSINKLALLSESSALPLLCDIIRNPEPTFSRPFAAISALGQIGSPGALHRLAEVAEDGCLALDVRARALECCPSADRWVGQGERLAVDMQHLLRDNSAQREISWLHGIRGFASESGFENFERVPRTAGATEEETLESDPASEFDRPDYFFDDRKSETTRRATILRLASQQPHRFTLLFRHLAENPALLPSLRAASAWASGKIRDETAGEWLFELFTAVDSPDILKCAAALSLGRLHYEVAADILITAGRSLAWPWPYRQFAIVALACLPGDGPTGALSQIASEARQGRQCQRLALQLLAGRASPEAVDDLAIIAQDPAQNGTVRISAVEALAELTLENCLGVLSAIATDAAHPVAVRVAAIAALTSSADIKAAPTLESALQDKTLPRYPRSFAARALGRIGAPRSIPALIAAVSDDTLSSGRRHVVAALGWIGGPQAAQALVTCASLPLDSVTMFFVAEALGRCGGAKVIASLSALMLNSRQPASVREAAARALGWIGDDEATASLLDVVHGPTVRPTNLRLAALRAMARIADKRATEPILEILTAEDNSLRLRRDAARVLFRMSDRRSANPLLAITLDPTCPISVRCAAVRALGRCGDSTHLPALQVIAEDHLTHAGLRISAIIAHCGLAGGLDPWVLTVATNSSKVGAIGMKSSKLRGAILKITRSRARGSAWNPYLRQVAKLDYDRGNRTLAVSALVNRRALDADTIRELLEEARRGTSEYGSIVFTSIPKACVGEVIRQFAAGEPDASTLLECVIEFLCDPNGSSARSATAFDALNSLKLEDAERCHNAIAARIRSRGFDDDSGIGKQIKRSENVIRNRIADSLLEAQLRNSPEDVLRAHCVDKRLLARGVEKPPKAVIVTATVRERKSVLMSLQDDHHVVPMPAKLHGRIVDDFAWARREGPPWIVSVMQPTDKGPLPVQAMVSDLLAADTAVALVLLVGCCAGFPERGAKKGDVIVARRIQGYQRRRHLADGIEISTDPYPMDPGLADSVNYLLSRPDFTLPEGVSLHFKDVASAEDLIDDLGSSLRAQVLGLSGEILGFEMEGQGFAHSLYASCGNGNSVRGLLIKGVSDFGDGQMSVNKPELQDRATRNALNFALAFLGEL